jgi:hypothetical protein
LEYDIIGMDDQLDKPLKVVEETVHLTLRDVTFKWVFRNDFNHIARVFYSSFVVGLGRHFKQILCFGLKMILVRFAR